MNRDVDRYYELIEEVEEIAEAAGRDPGNIQLVVVSKTHPMERILPLYEAGVRVFGENRMQEVLPKIDACPPDIR